MITPDEFAELKARVKTLEEKMADTAFQLSENTELTRESVRVANEIKKSTQALVNFTADAQGAINTLNWFIKISKPFAWLGVMAGAIYAAGVAAKAFLIHLAQQTPLGK